MMPHVVFLNPIGGIGGAERILLAIAKHLKGQHSGLNVSAILFGAGPLQEALTDLGVTVRILPLPEAAAELGDTKLRGRSRFKRLTAFAGAGVLAGPDLLGHARRLRNLLHELRPSFIHSNGLKAHFLGALAAPSDIPVLWHVHDFYSQRPLMANVLRLLSNRWDPLESTCRHASLSIL